MFTVAVSRDFVAQHVLTAGSGGPEHVWHSHSYRMPEVSLEGGSLDGRATWSTSPTSRPRLDPWSRATATARSTSCPSCSPGSIPSLEDVARVACEALAAAARAPHLQR